MITLRPSHSILLYTFWYYVVQALSSCPFGDGYRQIWYGCDPQAHRLLLQNSIWSNTFVQHCDQVLAKTWPSPQYFSNKKIVTLASFDIDMLHSIMNDIQLNNANKNIVIAFYLITNGNYNYLGCLETACEILDKVFKKYNHYISLSNENVHKYNQVNSCWYIDNTNYITGKKDTGKTTCSKGNYLYNGVYNNEYVIRSKQDLNLNDFETQTANGNIQCNMKLESFEHYSPEERNMVCTPINININLSSQNKKEFEDGNNDGQIAMNWNVRSQLLNQQTENKNDVEESQKAIPSEIIDQNIVAKICGSNQVTYYPYARSYQSFSDNIQEQEKKSSTSSNLLHVNPGIFNSYSTDVSSNYKLGYQLSNFNPKANIYTAPFASSSSFSNYQYQTQIQKPINQINNTNSLSISNINVDQGSSQLYPFESTISKFEGKTTTNSDNSDNKISGNNINQYSVSNVSPFYATQTQSSIKILPNTKTKSEEGLDSQITSNAIVKLVSNSQKRTSTHDIENDESSSNNCNEWKIPQNFQNSIVNVNFGTINYSPECQIQRRYKIKNSQQSFKPNTDWNKQGIRLEYTPSTNNYPSLTKSISVSSSDSTTDYKKLDSNDQINYLAQVSAGSSQLATGTNSILKIDDEVSTVPKPITETVVSNINVEPFNDNNVQLYLSTSNFVSEPITVKSSLRQYPTIPKTSDLKLSASISESTAENYPAATKIEKSPITFPQSINTNLLLSASVFQGTSTSYPSKTKMDRFFPTSTSTNVESLDQTKNNDLQISNIDVSSGSSVNYLSSSQVIQSASPIESKINVNNVLGTKQENLRIPTYYSSKYGPPKSLSQIKSDNDLSDNQSFIKTPSSDTFNTNKFSHPNSGLLPKQDIKPNAIQNGYKSPTYSVYNKNTGTANYYAQSTQFDSIIKYSSPVSTTKPDTSNIYNVLNVEQPLYTNYQNEIQINNQDNFSLNPKQTSEISKFAAYKGTSVSDISSLHPSESLTSQISLNPKQTSEISKFASYKGTSVSDFSSLHPSESLTSPLKQNFEATDNLYKAKGDLEDSASYAPRNDDSKSQSTKQYFNLHNIHASINNIDTSTAYPFKFETTPAKTIEQENKSQKDSIIGYNYKASAVPGQLTSLQSKIDIKSVDEPVKLEDKPNTQDFTYKSSGVPGFSTSYFSETGTLNSNVKKSELPKLSDFEYKATGVPGVSTTYPFKIEMAKLQEVQPKEKPPKLLEHSYKATSTSGSSTIFPYKIDIPSIPKKGPPEQSPNTNEYTYKGTSTLGLSTVYASTVDVKPSQTENQEYRDNLSEFKTSDVSGTSNDQQFWENNLPSQKTKLENEKTKAQSETNYQTHHLTKTPTLSLSELSSSNLQTIKHKHLSPSTYSDTIETTPGTSTYYPYQTDYPTRIALVPKRHKQDKSKDFENNYKCSMTTGATTFQSSGFDVTSSQAVKEESTTPKSSSYTNKAFSVPDTSMSYPFEIGSTSIQASNQKSLEIDGTRSTESSPKFQTSRDTLAQNLQSEKHIIKPTDNIIGKTNDNILSSNKISNSSPDHTQKILNVKVTGVSNSLNTLYPATVTYSPTKDQLPKTQENKIPGVNLFAQTSNQINTLYQNQITNKTPIESDEAYLNSAINKPLLGITTNTNNGAATFNENGEKNKNYFTKLNENVSSKTELNILGTLSSPSDICNNKFSWQNMATSTSKQNPIESDEASLNSEINKPFLGITTNTNNGAATFYENGEKSQNYFAKNYDNLSSKTELNILGTLSSPSDICNNKFSWQNMATSTSKQIPIESDEASLNSEINKPFLGITTNTHNGAATFNGNGEKYQNYFAKNYDNLSSKTELNILGTLSSPSDICNNKFSWQNMATSTSKQNQIQQYKTPEFHITGSRISQSTASYSPSSYKISPTSYRTEDSSQNIPSSSNYFQDISSSSQQNLYSSSSTSNTDLASSGLISSNLIKNTNYLSPSIKESINPDSSTLCSSIPCPISIHNKELSSNLPNITPEYTKNDETQYGTDNNSVKTEKQEICLGNTCTMNYLPTCAENAFTIQTNDPNIKLKGWKSQGKIVTRKLVIETTICSVTNFIPIVNDRSFDEKTVQCIARDAIKNLYGDPVVIKGFLNMYKPFAVVSNVDDVKLKTTGCILWPTCYSTETV